MDEPCVGQLPLFNTIGLAEKIAVNKALRSAPLSGYLGGINKAGYWVERLQDNWCEAFHCKYAVACNSATSGLLAACMAVGVGPGDTVWTSAYTMSATAACAKVLGANIVFIDIETVRFSMNMSLFRGPMPKCIIVTNLFGHPAYLSSIRAWCDSNKVYMIEDNAQAPFAQENGKYAGTVGHIGVFSLNVHKHIQSGEGGVIVTGDSGLHGKLAGAINHAELGRNSLSVGLNLRMTETTAAIAVAQLARAKGIIRSRCDLASELTNMFCDVPWLKPQIDDVGCKHVYYVWACRVFESKRPEFVRLLNLRGFPMRVGYAWPLNDIFGSSQTCEIAAMMEYTQLVTFEVCRYDPNRTQRRKMAEVAKRVVGDLS